MCDSSVSEQFAFDQLGLGSRQCVVTEKELVSMGYANAPIPEGIWEDDGGTRTSVEVKRVIGNTLPTDNNNGRRRIRWRSKVIWPWSTTVESAVMKGASRVNKDYGVSRHVVAFVVPETLDKRHKQRVVRHIRDVAEKTTSKLFEIKVKVYIFEAPPAMFDRLF